MLILIGLALAVPTYEGARLCLARWGAMTGSVRSVETPVLDRMSGLVQSAAGSVRRSTSSTFENVPWKPGLAIPIAAGWCLIAMLFLRRG